MISEVFDLSNAEARSWYLRYLKVSTILNRLDSEVKEDVSLASSCILDDFFYDFPAIKKYIESEEITYELYHVLIPVLEDVLAEKGLRQ